MSEHDTAVASTMMSAELGSAYELQNNAISSNTEIWRQLQEQEVFDYGNVTYSDCVNVTYSECLQPDYYCGSNSSSLDDLVCKRCNTTRIKDGELVESVSNLIGFCILIIPSSYELICLSSGESLSGEFQLTPLPGGTSVELVNTINCENGVLDITTNCEDYDSLTFLDADGVNMTCGCDGVNCSITNCEEGQTFLNTKGVNMTVECDGVHSATNECEIDQAYKSINRYWYLFYLIGSLMVILSCTLKYMITRRVFVASNQQPLNIEQDQNLEVPLTNALWFELIVRFMFDIALVNIFLLSASLVSMGGVDGNGDACNTYSFIWQLVYASAVYAVDVLGDFNALYWGSIVGFHAKDYESAKFEGLERVHGYATIIPVFAYCGAATTWIIEAGYPKIEDPASIAIWVSIGLLFATIFFSVLYELYYSRKYIPGWGCKGCRCSWICNYCYRNKGPQPQHGPVWGGAGAAAGMGGLLMCTLAEAISVWFLDTVEFAILFMILLSLEIILVGVQWYSGRKSLLSSTNDEGLSDESDPL